MIRLIMYILPFQDYAESTMNELLGWYGYDNAVDSDDTQDLDLQRFSISKVSLASAGKSAPLASLSRLKLAAAAAVQARVAAVAVVNGLGGVVREGQAGHRDTPSNDSIESLPSRLIDNSSPGGLPNRHIRSPYIDVNLLLLSNIGIVYNYQTVSW